jgi:hypothetical protein
MIARVLRTISAGYPSRGFAGDRHECFDDIATHVGQDGCAFVVLPDVGSFDCLAINIPGILSIPADGPRRDGSNSSCVEFR